MTAIEKSHRDPTSLRSRISALPTSVAGSGSKRIRAAPMALKGLVRSGGAKASCLD
jgi:hypothetical protein